MYSKYGLANWICSAKWGKLVGKWPMADCYFKLCYSIYKKLLCGSISMCKYSQVLILLYPRLLQLYWSFLAALVHYVNMYSIIRAWLLAPFQVPFYQQPKGYLMAKNENIPFSDIIYSYHSHYSMHKPWLYFHKSKKKIHNDKIKTYTNMEIFLMKILFTQINLWNGFSFLYEKMKLCRHVLQNLFSYNCDA